MADANAAVPGSPAELEALLQFMYLAPVGLAQLAADGGIVLANPLAAQLLMPLSRDGGLDNFHALLQDALPGLERRVAAFSAAHGVVCDGVRFELRPGGRRVRVVSLTLLKLDPARLMAVLTDVTEQVERDRVLRQSEGWLRAMLDAGGDYAQMRLDAAGRIADWNDGIRRVVGHTAAVVGRSCALFDPRDEGGSRMRERLREADAHGLSLDEGWRIKADGSVFWSSSAVVPLRDRCAGDEPSYHFVIRDNGLAAPPPAGS